MHKYFYNTKILRISYSKNRKQKGVLELFGSEDRKVLAGLHVVVDWVSNFAAIASFVCLR